MEQDQASSWNCIQGQIKSCLLAGILAAYNSILTTMFSCHSRIPINTSSSLLLSLSFELEIESTFSGLRSEEDIKKDHSSLS